MAAAYNMLQTQKTAHTYYILHHHHVDLDLLSLCLCACIYASLLFVGVLHQQHALAEVLVTQQGHIHSHSHRYS